MKNDSYVLYEFQEKTIRHILIGYESLVAISTLIGDTLILFGSLRYNAIKLHKIIVIFIQYIAVNDLLAVIFTILPGLVSLVANDWILPNIFCYLTLLVYASSVAFLSQLISILALSKLLIAKHPLRAMSVSKNTAHIIACTMWVYSLSFPIACIAKDKSGVYYASNIYNCDYGVDSNIWTPLEMYVYFTAIGASLFVSLLITVVCSVMLIVEARRVVRRMTGRVLQWQGILTILITVAVHSLGSIPSGIYYCFYILFPNANYVEELYRCAWFISLIGAVSNFYIFTLTLSSFREFVRSNMMIIVAPLMRCFTTSQDEVSGEEGERITLLN